MKIPSRTALKLTAIISFILLGVVAWLAHQNPATGYELSIYPYVPSLVWIFLIVSILGGLIIVVHQAVIRDRDSHFWLIGILILVFSTITFTWLPYIRGYTLWHGDNMTHIGFIKDIVLTGHFAENNFYPISHILVAVVMYVTGISNLVIANVTNALFSLLYVIALYSIATVALPQKGQQILVAALTVTIPLGIYHIWLTANSWALFYFPILFFILIKGHFLTHSQFSYRLLLIIILIIQPFFHPLSALMVMIGLLVMALIEAIFAFFKWRKKTDVTRTVHMDLLIHIAIVSIVFSQWVLSFSALRRNLRVVYEQISTGLAPNVIDYMGERLGKIDVQGFDFVELLIRMYGTELFLIALSLIGIFFLIKQLRSGKFSREITVLLHLSLIFLSFGFLYFLTLLSVPGTDPLGGARGLSYTMLFAPLLAGYTLYELLRIPRFRYLAGAGIILMVLLVTSIRIFSIYPSSGTYLANVQVTHMDMTGMTWFFEEKNTSIASVNIRTPVGRFAQAILGTKAASTRADLDRGDKTGVLVPDHFGYTDYSSLGQVYDEDKYIPVRVFDRIVYSTIWETVGRFDDNDFTSLENDPAVDKLYSNGELDFYYVHSTK